MGANISMQRTANSDAAKVIFRVDPTGGSKYSTPML